MRYVRGLPNARCRQADLARTTASLQRGITFDDQFAVVSEFGDKCQFTLIVEPGAWNLVPAPMPSISYKVMTGTNAQQ